MRWLILRWFGHLSPREFFPYVITALLALMMAVPVTAMWLVGSTTDALLMTGVALLMLAVFGWRAHRDAHDPADPGFTNALWRAAEKRAEKDGGNVVFEALWGDVMMNYPMRDTDAAADYIVEHHFGDRPVSEVMELIEAAPPGPRTVLRAMFNPNAEEKPW